MTNLIKTNMFLSSFRWKYCVQDKFLFSAIELQFNLAFVNCCKASALPIRQIYFCHLTASLASFEIPSFSIFIFKLRVCTRSYERRTILRDQQSLVEIVSKPITKHVSQALVIERTCFCRGLFLDDFPDETELQTPYPC